MTKIYWNKSKQYNNSDILISIYLKENELEVKKKFHQTVNDFANLRLNNKSIIDLTSELDINLWNSSLLAEKSFYKTPEIFSFLKILSLEIYIKSKKCSEINIYNCSNNEKWIIKLLLKENNIKCNFHYSYRSKIKFRYFIPHFLQALLWFCMKTWSFLGLKSKINIKNESQVLVYSTLSHLDINFKRDIKIMSKVWGELPKLLKTHELKVKWLYDFTKGKYTETPKKAFELLKSNPNNAHEAHSLLVPLKKGKVLFCCIKLFIKYYFFYSNKFKFLKYHLKSSKNILIICYFKMFKFNFYNSFFGICAIENILYSLTFDDILGSLNKQNLGLYINENQGWETLFIKSWKKYNHGKLVSVQHSTVRFWDLRYYHNEWIKDSSTPSFISVNGNAAKTMFLYSNYPNNKIIKLESLRYSYLSNFKKCININKSKNILVLGDYIVSKTLKMINIVQNISNFNEYNFTFKSHPAGIINPLHLKKFNLTSNNLNDLFSHFDTVICPVSSGSSIEAFIVGLKTILYIDDEMDTSPIYRYSNSIIFSTEDQLLICLEEPKSTKNIQDFFYLNSGYKYWNQLLKSI